jgi:hypothetical protein
MLNRKSLGSVIGPALTILTTALRPLNHGLFQFGGNLYRVWSQSELFFHARHTKKTRSTPLILWPFFVPFRVAHVEEKKRSL